MVFFYLDEIKIIAEECDFEFQIGDDACTDIDLW